MFLWRYKKPVICDAENLIEVSKALADTEIICGDFEESRKYVRKTHWFILIPLIVLSAILPVYKL